MSDIQPGDNVVCVDNDVVPTKSGMYAELPKVGRSYRVLAVGKYDLDDVAVTIEGVSPDPFPGHHHLMFRKIDAPDTKISRRIRACKPIRETAFSALQAGYAIPIPAGRVPSEPGSHPSGHAACGVDGAPRFDPSRGGSAHLRNGRN
jgi:hypothetical protein